MHEGAQVAKEEHNWGFMTVYARVTSTGEPRVNQWLRGWEQRDRRAQLEIHKKRNVFELSRKVWLQAFYKNYRTEQLTAHYFFSDGKFNFVAPM